MPLCNAEGMFVPLQCFEHDVYGKQCWCVDSSGQEIKGTRLDNGTAPECGECKQTSNFSNRPFYSCVLSYREARGDLALIQTCLLFSFECQLVSIRKT